jgi:hypothetical protein
MQSSNDTQPKRLRREEAREALPENLRETFDKLCDDTIAWSKYYYGTTMVSYSILMRLVEDGWARSRKNDKV